MQKQSVKSLLTVEQVLIELDRFADIGMSEMIYWMRIHVQEVTRFSSLIVSEIELSAGQIKEFEADCGGYSIDPAPYLVKYPNGLAHFTLVGVFLIKICAKVHDIGKPFFRDLYAKERGLTEDEFRLQKLHAHLSRIIIKSWGSHDVFSGQQNILNFIADMAAGHQEKFDGTGYPDGSCAKEAGLISRILGIIDAVSAMVTPRSYTTPIPLEECLGRIESDKVAHFDPVLSDMIIKILKSDKHSQQRFSGEWSEVDVLSIDYANFIKVIDLKKIDLCSGDEERLSELEGLISKID